MENWESRVSLVYTETEPLEAPPAGHPPGKRWKFEGPQQILVEWHSREAAESNAFVADDSSATTADYRPANGLEALACPCGRYERLTVSGVWGGPLELTCRCSRTHPFTLVAAAPWGVSLLKRLILWYTDDTCELRHLTDLIIEHHVREQQDRTRHGVDPGPELLTLARAAGEDGAGGRLSRYQRALTALRVSGDGDRPRYAGLQGTGPLALYLVRAMYAVVDGRDYDIASKPGRRLVETIDWVIADLLEYGTAPHEAD